MIEIFFFCFATSIYFISAGIFFENKILQNTNIHNENIYKLPLYGGILLAFLGLFFNFFMSLGKNLNSLIYLFFFIYLIFSQTKYLKKILISSIIISFICSILLIHETTYRPDAGLYHLPFVSILNNEKIIIGLSNIHFRFGHTSITQYISALNNNWLFSDKGILIPTSVIYGSFLFYLINEIKNYQNKSSLIFNLIIFSFLCLKLNRYSDFGNDAPAHIYYFFLTSIAVSSFSNLSKNKMSEIIILSAYIVFNKITLFLGSLITLFFLILRKNFYYFNLRPIIFISLFTFLFFFKNFLISGCFAFPIEKTCLSNVQWFDTGGNKNSIAKVTMLENEAWTKGWSDQKGKIKNYELYLSDYNWIKIWSNNHGKRILYKIMPFLAFIIFLFLFLYFIKSETIKYSKHRSNKSEKKYLTFFLILNLVGITIWFLKFPVFRYGYSYIILFLNLLFLTFIYDKLQNVEIKKYNRAINIIVIFLITVLISKNLLRIIKNYDNNYNFAPWPKIYSYSKLNNKQKYEKIKKNNTFLFYYSKSGLCMYGPSPCSHYINKNLELRTFNKYKIYYITCK